MSDLMIEHMVEYSVEYRYGRLKWPKCDNDVYSKIFPDGHFDIIFDGILLKNRRVDWKLGRVALPNSIKQKLVKGRLLEIKRIEDKIIIISKY